MIVRNLYGIDDLGETSCNRLHPRAVEYNELGNRLLDIAEMMVSARDDAVQMDDPMAAVLFGMAWQKEVEEIRSDRKAIEAELLRESEWSDHWLEA